MITCDYGEVIAKHDVTASPRLDASGVRQLAERQVASFVCLINDFLLLCRVVKTYT